MHFPFCDICGDKKHTTAEHEDRRRVAPEPPPETKTSLGPHWVMASSHTMVEAYHFVRDGKVIGLPFALCSRHISKQKIPDGLELQRVGVIVRGHYLPCEFCIKGRLIK